MCDSKDENCKIPEMRQTKAAKLTELADTAEWENMDKGQETNIKNLKKWKVLVAQA